MTAALRSLARVRRAWWLRVLVVAAGGWGALGCTPHIGSQCNLSTDCSSQGDRLCDTSQPGGYCTILNCTSFSCPDHAACVMFETTLPGCNAAAAYGDYQQPSRTGLSFCMQHCGVDSDCRDGYECKNPRFPPWNATILSPDQTWAVCISKSQLMSSVSDAATDEASVCSASLPPILATMMDAAPDVETPAEAGGSGGDGAPEDAPPDAPPADAALDAATSSDATGSASFDAANPLDAADATTVDGAVDAAAGD
jgi:hypothetical protein